MHFSVIQGLLVGLVGFMVGIDQFSFLESLYRPIVVGPIVGMILGRPDLGLTIGASVELMLVGSMPIGGAQPPNAGLAAIMAVILGISLGQEDPQAALGIAIPFALLGQYAVNIMFTITSPLMSKADEMAAKADVKGIEMLNYGTMFGIGALFAILGFIGTMTGGWLGEWMAANVPAQIWTGLGAAGGMMRFVGFAVLMKVMISGDTWTILFAGFALANIIGATPLAPQTIVLVSFVGLAIAVYDYQMNIKIKENGGAGQGGMSDGI